MDTPDSNFPRRRTILGGVGAAAMGVVAGCSSEAGGAVVPPALKGKIIARTGEIPVGGGKVFSKEKVVVTQPTQGVFKAFTATCPHQGCAVSRVREDHILCPCHGSEFALDSGKVKKGPSPAPLAEFKVQIKGDGITLV